MRLSLANPRVFLTRTARSTRFAGTSGERARRYTRATEMRSGPFFLLTFACSARSATAPAPAADTAIHGPSASASSLAAPAGASSNASANAAGRAVPDAAAAEAPATSAERPQELPALTLDEPYPPGLPPRP